MIYSKIVAIVVTYNPDLTILGQLVDRCGHQVEAIILVDNSGNGSLKDWLTQRANSHVTLLSLSENQGVAAAQNAGIDWARTRGAEHVLVFDQDSNPPLDLVVRLRAALADLEQAGKKVAAVGPRHIDNRRKDAQKISPFLRFNGRMMRCYPENASPYVAVDFLISSGSLIPLKALDAIGGFADCLFIDYVDIEWGLRAHSKGWSTYGVWDIVMEHGYGDGYIYVFGKEIAIHTPLRHYYLIRNAVWLCRQSWPLTKWKTVIIQKTVKRIIVYSIFMPKPFKHFRFMCLGLWHGVCGRMGKL